MYEPESHGENEWRLPEQLSEHMKKFLKDFSALELKNMREDCPRPSEDFLSPRPMDKEMWKLIPQKAMERAKDTDGMFRAIFMAAADLMGPMGKAWTSMHQAKQELMENQEPSCDLDQVLTNLEQSAVLMAHLLYLIEEKRRLCSLRAFLKEPKAASQLLREAEDENQAWQSQPNTLFGKDFFTDSLKSKAKEGRDLQDVKKSLGWAKPQPRAPVRQPFRGGPPGTPRLQWGQYGQFGRPYPHGNTNRSGAPRQKGPGKPGPAATVSKAKTSGGKSSDSKYRYVPYFPWGVAYWPSNTYYARTEPTFQGPGARLGLHGQVPFAGRWPLKIFHSQLESNHTRSDSAASSSRLPSRPGGLSQTAQSNSRAEIPTEGVGISKSGDSQLTGERSHCGNNPTGNEVLESGVYQGQERGGTETSDKPESSEPVRSIRAFQDGEHDDATIPDSIQRLDGENGHKGCISDCPNSPETPEFAGVSVEQQILQIPGSPIWTGVSTQNFHQDIEASSGIPATNRNSDDNLSGRLFDPEPGQRKTSSRQGHCLMDFSNVGPDNKLEEVLPNPTTTNGISWLPGELEVHDVDITTRQDPRHTEAMFRDAEKGDIISETFGKIDWQADSFSTGSFVSSTKLSQTTNAEEQSSAKGTSMLRSNSDIDSGLQEGTAMVGGGTTGMQWESNPQTSTGLDHHYRCFQNRLGGGR
jgi:hypothetical protein